MWDSSDLIMNKITRALISVSGKSVVTEFAQALHARDIEILSTGGTASGRVRKASDGVA